MVLLVLVVQIEVQSYPFEEILVRFVESLSVVPGNFPLEQIQDFFAPVVVLFVGNLVLHELHLEGGILAAHPFLGIPGGP